MTSLQPFNSCMSHTYSCVNMCTCTNQYWSCDHPDQTLPQFLSALVYLETTTLLSTHCLRIVYISSST